MLQRARGYFVRFTAKYTPLDNPAKLQEQKSRFQSHFISFVERTRTQVRHDACFLHFFLFYFWLSGIRPVLKSLADVI